MIWNAKLLIEMVGVVVLEIEPMLMNVVVLVMDLNFHRNQYDHH
jgi:hypothetical protein